MRIKNIIIMGIDIYFNCSIMGYDSLILSVTTVFWQIVTVTVK